MTEETPEAQALRLNAYSLELARVSAVYAEAARAVGLRKDAARYLASEAERLERESRVVYDRASDLYYGATGRYLP